VAEVHRGPGAFEDVGGELGRGIEAIGQPSHSWAVAALAGLGEAGRKGALGANQVRRAPRQRRQIRSRRFREEARERRQREARRHFAIAGRREAEIVLPEAPDEQGPAAERRKSLGERAFVIPSEARAIDEDRGDEDRGDEMSHLCVCC
jgi:hypothetical protein